MGFSWGCMRSRILLLLTLLVASACSTSQDMTVTKDGLELRAEAKDDAQVVERLALGTKVKVHDAPFWVSSDWHFIETSKGQRWTKLEGLALYPLRGETRFVRLEELEVHATRGDSGRVVETLKLGDEVQLLAEEPPGDAEYHGVIKGGTLRGYVDGFGLAPEKPLTRTLLASAAELLKKSDFERAKQLAQAALAMAEKTGRSGALVEAITLAQTEATALREELIGFTEKAASDVPPHKGALGYVVPYRAAVREGPDDRDEIITVLAPDTAVQVLDIKGPAAQVELVPKRTPWMAVELGDLAKVKGGETAALSPAQRSGRTRGYMQLAMLQSKRLSVAEHLAKVNALSKDEHPEERLELLKRAALIAEPKELPSVATALIDEAFQNERYRLAVAAAVRLKEASTDNAQEASGSAWKIDSVTSMYGCSGSPLESQVEVVEFQPDGEFSKPTGSTCALVTGLASPCDVCLSDLSEYDKEDHQHVLRDKVGIDNALSQHEDVITNYLKATSRLEDAYPRPSRMRVTVRSAASAPPGRLFVFELPLEVERYSTQLGIKPLFKEARVSEVALPESAAGGRWEYWMSTLQWEDSAHGAIFSPDPKTAWMAIQAFAKAVQTKPQELLSRNQEGGVVYALHLSPSCGRCPDRRK